MDAVTEEEGYTKSYRRKWRNPVFRNLRDAAVWAWMTDVAAWRETCVRFADRLVPLRRGQLVTSERFIAEGFCMDRQVVRRLFDTLEENGMVVRQKTHGGTILTISNYDRYQATEDPEKRTHGKPTSNPRPHPPENPPPEVASHSNGEDISGTSQVENPPENPGSPRRHTAANPNKKEGKKEEEVPIAKAIGADALAPLDLRAELWRTGKAFLAKYGFDRDAAGKLLGKWRRSAGDIAVINALAAAEAECAQDVVPFIEACLKRGKNGKSGQPVEDRSAFRGGLARAALARVGPGEPAVPDDLARRDPASVG